MDVLNSVPAENLFSNVLMLNNSDWSFLNLDLYDVLSVSDGLISDLSSVVIDYILSNKPIALTVNSFDDYSRGMIDCLDIEARLKFYKISKMEDFYGYFSYDTTIPIRVVFFIKTVMIQHVKKW